MCVDERNAAVGDRCDWEGAVDENQSDWTCATYDDDDDDAVGADAAVGGDV